MSKVIVIDNLSPFTPDILGCLDRLGKPYVCKKYSEVRSSDLKCDNVILSGRHKNDSAINAANSKIVRYCQNNDLPLLGICYGSEIIVLALGGTLRKMASHVQGPISVTLSIPNPLTLDKKAISVYESHGYCVARLPSGFDVLAGSQYCEYEIFAHRTKKIFGTQFHPEKSGSDGQDLIANFVKL